MKLQNGSIYIRSPNHVINEISPLQLAESAKHCKKSHRCCETLVLGPTNIANEPIKYFSNVIMYDE